MKTVLGNIRKNYIFSFLCNTAFSESIWVLYLASRGMNLIQIGILESIFHITNMLCEVPTGYIADRFGRRTSRIMGRGAAFISTIIMITGSSFWQFALGLIFSALSYNLESGAGDALIYDSMMECGQEDRYMEVRSKQEICFQSAKIISLVAGGMIATYSYLMVYGVTAAIHLASLIFSFSFKEPQVGKVTERINFFRHVRDSIRVVWEHKGVLKYILYFESFSLFLISALYDVNYLLAQGWEPGKDRTKFSWIQDKYAKVLQQSCLIVYGSVQGKAFYDFLIDHQLHAYYTDFLKDDKFIGQVPNANIEVAYYFKVPEAMEKQFWTTKPEVRK